MDTADHHAAENHRTEAASEIETKDFNLVPKKMKKITRKPDFDKSEELEADIEVKVFDVMPERGDDDKSGKGVSQLLAEIEMEAKEREMEWKMSESRGVEDEFVDLFGIDHGNFICTSYGSSGNKMKY